MQFVFTRIYDASKDVPFFHLEDVYTTGLVANKKLGFKPVSIPGMFNYRPPFKSCFYANSLIASHAYNVQTMRDTWRKVKAISPKCNLTVLAGITAADLTEAARKRKKGLWG